MSRSGAREGTAAWKPTWPDRMNPTDAVFWFMDKIPEFRSTIGALVILERQPSLERVRQEFERLASHLVRFRQRVVEVPFTLAAPEWVDDPQLDLEYHVRGLGLPSPAGMDELLTELGALYATPFDPDRPLWEVYAVEGLRDGRGAIFVKMHHCVTDGVGGSRMFEDMIQGPEESAPHPWHPRRRSTSPPALLWRAAAHNAREAFDIGSGALASLADAARDPRAAMRSLLPTARALRGTGEELTKPAAPSPLHSKRSLSRRLATFEMSIPEIDAMRGRLGATINDVVLTIVCGAMHRWHSTRGSDVAELRALVPVSIRPSDDATAGNQIALLALRLPIGEPNPLRRLRGVQERIGKVKQDRRATMYPLVARLVMSLPVPLAKIVGHQQTARTNFVCTNVPGPRRTGRLAGEAIERIYPYAPLVGDHPVAIALYSYCDTLCVGLDVDPLSMPDLPHFLDALRESYEETLAVGR